MNTTTRDVRPLDSEASIGDGVSVLVHLSGARRGTTERLGAQTVRIGTTVNAEVHFPADREPAVAPCHGVLRQRGNTYELRVQPGRQIRVNGTRVDAATLSPEDLLQIGEHGPFLRFRRYARKPAGYKSMTEVLSDCVDCARYGGHTPLKRAAIFLAAAPRELATQTAPLFRVGMVLFMTLLTASVIALTMHSVRLEQRLQAEQLRVSSIARLLPHSDSALLTSQDLDAVHTQMETQVSNAIERIDALETRLAAARSIISAAARSIVLLQGAYGFVETASGKPLRYVGLDANGVPLRDSAGDTFVTTEGTGPFVESLFTGTAFVASGGGLLLTNRHVAMPWELDETTEVLIKRGFRPLLHRFLGYLPGIEEPFELKLVAASDQADVAVLRCSGVTRGIRALKLSTVSAQPGDEVIVMGYPTGIRALLARSDKTFIEKLKAEHNMGFWTVAQRLSSRGGISPLATRGIVGQVNASAVVYDAQTTSGGSGGPVLSLSGEVVAINTGIMPEFGGSNLGVPAEQVQKLLASARGRSP
jgi:serine protease Do